ncbi:MAG: alpha/beta hydrolase [Agathobacter sp.]|nr:alpha/beta hydrolase [Agathobacter sp.]
MGSAFLILGILLVIIIFLNAMAKVAVRPKVHTLQYELDKLVTYDYMKDESIDIINEHKVKSFDGYELWTGFVQGDPENKHYVILSHGYTSTRYGMYKYAVIWRRLGYNCVLYENRGHGVNEPDFISFGWRESKDLMAVIEDTYERYGRDIQIGLHGESMGAGLQLMALSYNPKVDFIVNDCGYSEIFPVLSWKVTQTFHLPSWLPKLASPIVKLLHGFRFEDVRPIDRLTTNEIPICFVHGLDDTFTHCWHSEKMYEANKGYKELHLYEGADHAECVVIDTNRYQKMLSDFVKKVYKSV